MTRPDFYVTRESTNETFAVIDGVEYPLHPRPRRFSLRQIIFYLIAAAITGISIGTLLVLEGVF